MSPGNKYRNVIVILGDQLDRNAAWRSGFDPDKDVIWMAEAVEESKYVWSHKQRITLFLTAMRHMCEDLKREGLKVYYHRLEEVDPRSTLTSLLETFCQHNEIGKVVLLRPGEWRLYDRFQKLLEKRKISYTFLEDDHFFIVPDEFKEWAKDRKSLRMEYFYRHMRKREKVLLEKDGTPVGGDWNYDQQNRKSFTSKGPPPVPEAFWPLKDNIREEVCRLVADRFADHPGELSMFRWPVTPQQAETMLEDFLEHRLASFGDYQDAMWTGEPFLFHSLLSTSLNLKLLHPRKVVAAAEKAYREKGVPLAAVEGFIRQILGWREYVRGVYWMYMPDYVERNTLRANEPLPDFYWTGKVKMNCLSKSIGQTLRYGYAHHIQRLMVTGLYALLLGVRPREVHEWYLAIYVDAIEWVELPNTLGMSQFADDGVMASKPYAATGKYIKRMSNYCRTCPFNPDEAVGESACPFTTLYWDFLYRNRDSLKKNRRISLQVKNLERLSADRMEEIRERAQKIRKSGGCPPGNSTS